MKQGINTFYLGTLRNVRAVEKHNKNNTKKWVENILDFEHVNDDGQPFLIEIKLSKTAQDSNAFAQFKPLIGKLLSLPIFVANNVYENRVYSQFYYTASGQPKIIEKGKESVV